MGGLNFLLAEIVILAIIWSLNLCHHSRCEAKSTWLPSMCGAKSANFQKGREGWKAAIQTSLRTWKGAMQTVLRTWSGHIVSRTKKLLKEWVKKKHIFIHILWIGVLAPPPKLNYYQHWLTPPPFPLLSTFKFC